MMKVQQYIIITNTKSVGGKSIIEIHQATPYCIPM